MQSSIKNIYKISRIIGYPDLLDPNYGGIAIWGKGTLSATRYKFLRRVELIDEKIPSTFPVPHVSNIYVWIRIPMNKTQVERVLDLSSNFMYDSFKKLLIIRSSGIERAVALGAIVKLYSTGKLSLYQIISYDLCKKYFNLIFMLYLRDY